MVEGSRCLVMNMIGESVNRCCSFPSVSNSVLAFLICLRKLSLEQATRAVRSHLIGSLISTFHGIEASIGKVYLSLDIKTKVSILSSSLAST